MGASFTLSLVGKLDKTWSEDILVNVARHW
jgi:hypothetical protein